MVAEKFVVDLSKPLVFQVGHLGKTYDEWVHQPIISKESPRFFANDLMEMLTRTRWWVIPTFWIPVVGWCLKRSVAMEVPVSQIASCIFAGVLAWTLLEYTLHRFIFHIQTTSYWANTLHYLAHGCHHKHPMDTLRLVFPPAATAMILPLIYGFIRVFAPQQIAFSLLGGLLLGYIFYDCTHYYVHHGKPSTGQFHNLKRYHMNHHYKIQDKGFGITSTFWDRVFGTLPPPASNKKSK